MAKTVGAIRTTLRILEELQERDEAGVTELSDSLDLPKSTVHSHLNTLQEQEYVVNDGEVYALGLQFLKLGEHSRDRIDLFEFAREEADALAERTGEVTNIATWEYGQGVYLYRAQGNQAVQLDTYAGMRFYLHCTALGKAILANLPEEDVNDIITHRGLPERTDATITSRDALYDELTSVRERGYAYDLEERLPGLRCVAAPITRTEGYPLGAISVAGPTNRMKDDRFETEIPEMLLNAANVIELNVQHS